MQGLAAALQARLAAEGAAAPVGTLQAWRAQLHSFSGGGALWMDAWGPPDGMLSWHARSFLRLALRMPPDGFDSPSALCAWRCCNNVATCRAFVPISGASAVMHASGCGETTRRHHAYAAAAHEVILAFAGAPQLRTEVPGVPAADCRMDAVVSGARVSAPEAGSSGPSDPRTLLIDFSVTEPVSSRMLRSGLGSHAVAGLAAAARRGEKERHYGAKVDTDRHRLLPWVVETWGRHDAPLVEFLRAAARLAAEERLPAPPSAAGVDDSAVARRLARVSATVFHTWMQRLSAGLVVSVAEFFDARFRPLRGGTARQSFRLLVPRGLSGRCPLDEGVLGVSGHVRGLEPRFAFSLAPCC